MVDGLKVELTKIGPKDAAAMLQMNTRNRRLNESRVDQYASAMREGRWSAVTQIAVSDEGVIIDGQHRLQAVLRSGTEQVFSVLWGSTLETQNNFDTHAKRTIAGQLSIIGATSASDVSTLLRPVMRWLAGSTDGSAFTSSHSRLGAKVGYPDVHQAVTFYEENRPEIDLAVRAVRRVRSAIGGSAGALGLLSFLGGRLNSDDRDDFFSRLATGGDLAAGSPILALRNRMIDERGRREKRSVAQSAAEVIKAWNAYRDGSEVRLLRWTGGGSNPEAFPTPR